MAPALASKTLEGVGVPTVGCTFMPSISPLTTLPLISTYGSPCPLASRYASARDGLSKTSPAIMGAGVAGSIPVCASPTMASLPGAAWGTSWAAALPYLVRAAINLAICCPNSVVPSPELVTTAALALNLSGISLFSLSDL